MQEAGVTLSSVEAQTREYAAKAPKPLQVPVRSLPFLGDQARGRALRSQPIVVVEAAENRERNDLAIISRAGSW